MKVVCIKKILAPNLLINIGLHCINRSKSNQNKIISSSPSNLGTSVNTFFYDHNEGEWITGPSLMNPRSSFAAGIVTDLATDEQLVAVTGGWSCDILTSTEILQNGEWVQGKTEKSVLDTVRPWDMH